LEPYPIRPEGTWKLIAITLKSVRPEEHQAQRPIDLKSIRPTPTWKLIAITLHDHRTMEPWNHRGVGIGHYANICRDHTGSPEDHELTF
jgi:hypothetical protein